MRAPHPIPSVEYLREVFEYDPRTGRLSYRERPETHFDSPNKCRAWNIQYARKECSARGRFGKTLYFIVSIDGRNFLAHRVAFKMLTGLEPPEVDHRDGDGLNNRGSNLRAADSRQNKQNARMKQGCASGFKGVRAAHKSDGFTASIRANGKRHHLGTFPTAEAASAAYAEAARRFHGEFGRAS